jgi:hypothetical protein
MLAALIVFLALTILGDIMTILKVGTDTRMNDGLRLFSIAWSIGCIAWAIFLIVMFAGK